MYLTYIYKAQKTKTNRISVSSQFFATLAALSVWRCVPVYGDSGSAGDARGSVASSSPLSRYPHAPIMLRGVYSTRVYASAKQWCSGARRCPGGSELRAGGEIKQHAKLRKKGALDPNGFRHRNHSGIFLRRPACACGLCSYSASVPVCVNRGQQAVPVLLR